MISFWDGSIESYLFAIETYYLRKKYIDYLKRMSR